LIEGGLVLPTRLELPAPPVSIVAGGWSFHALTADGRVISWGILNGGNWARQDSPLYEDGRCLRPAVLPQSEKLGPISQLDAGRSHTAMLGQDGRVWEMRAYGRVVEIRDEAQRWGVAGSEVTSVYAGWVCRDSAASPNNEGLILRFFLRITLLSLPKPAELSYGGKSLKDLSSEVRKKQEKTSSNLPRRKESLSP